MNIWDKIVLARIANFNDSKNKVIFFVSRSDQSFVPFTVKSDHLKLLRKWLWRIPGIHQELGGSSQTRWASTMMGTQAGVTQRVNRNWACWRSFQSRLQKIIWSGGARGSCVLPCVMQVWPVPCPSVHQQLEPSCISSADPTWIIFTWTWYSTLWKTREANGTQLGPHFNGRFCVCPHQAI